MANEVFLAKQKVVNRSGKTFGYELLFRDTKEGIKEFPSNIKATSNVLLNALTRMQLETIVSPGEHALINVDEKAIHSEIVTILDPNVFIIELLETITVDTKLIQKIAHLKKRGYTIAIDDFDCSRESIAQFKPLFPYISLVKIDLMNLDKINKNAILSQFRAKKIKLLAEKVETKEEMRQCIDEGYDLFQGYYIQRPQIIEGTSIKDVTGPIIMHLINLIRTEAETREIERFLKLKPQVTYNLIKYINNQEGLEDNITSITQAITLIGRKKLSRWLLIYMFSEISDSDISELGLQMALDRADILMEEYPQDKDKAFMTGLFSLLDQMFESDIETIFQSFKVDDSVRNAVMHKQGPLGKALIKAETIEKEKFQKLLVEKLDQLDSLEIAKILKSANAF